MEYVNIIQKIIQVIKAFFWKNSDVIYIHSNKKVFDHNLIDEKQSTKKSKWIINESNTHKIGFKFTKLNFRKGQIALYQITRNLKYKPKISYGGYVSVPLAAYDGSCLGDTRNYFLYDTMSGKKHAKRIEFNPSRNTSVRFGVDSTFKEVNLIVSSSFLVNSNAVRDGTMPTFRIDQLLKGFADSKYLIKMHSLVYDFLDECRFSGITKVHMYMSSRQAVSFAVGTAIQPHHSEVLIYEYEDARYTWNINVKKAKLEEEELDA